MVNAVHSGDYDMHICFTPTGGGGGGRGKGAAVRKVRRGGIQVRAGIAGNRLAPGQLEGQLRRGNRARAAAARLATRGRKR